VSRDRDLLLACSEYFKQRAVDAHAEGMNLTRRAAKLESMARLLPDEKVGALVDALDRAGLLIVVLEGPHSVNAKGGTS
jgi:hypothetical protein